MKKLIFILVVLFSISAQAVTTNNPEALRNYIINNSLGDGQGIITNNGIIDETVWPVSYPTLTQAWVDNAELYEAKNLRKKDVEKLRDQKLELSVTVAGDDYYSDLGTVIDIMTKKDRLVSGSQTVSSLTLSGNTATMTFDDLHLLPKKTKVFVSGANETEYNVSNKTATRASNNSITFNVTGSPSSPATGSISVSVRMPIILVDGSTNWLTLNQLINRSTSIVEYRYDCFDNARTHNGAIDLLTTVAAIESYDITANWPSTSL